MAHRSVVKYACTEKTGKQILRKGDDIRQMPKESLESAAANGRLKGLIERYLKTCRPPDGEDKKSSRFPNLAGFCRWLGCGMGSVERLLSSNPEAADYLLAVMEDEALNAPVISPTVVGAYLKRRLSYGEKPPSRSGSDSGELRLVFEHDIAEDGS